MVHLLNILAPINLTLILLYIVLCTLCSHGSSSAPGEVSGSIAFSFDKFLQGDTVSFNFSDLTSGVQNGALQVTYNTGSSSTSLVNISGQITYATRLRLWDPSYNHTSSFNTSFMINMGPTQGGGNTTISGGGMAFFLSPSPATNIQASHGSFLGLLNSSSYTTSRFVAIEFDTFRDTPSDPDGNHLGIDINSTQDSVWSQSLTPFNVTLDDYINGFNTSVWIDYDGDSRELDVYLENQGSAQREKPRVPILARFPIDLREHLPEDVFVGFSASTGVFKETHCVTNWNFSSTSFPTTTPPSSSVPDQAIIIIIGLSVGFSALAFVAAGGALILAVVIRKRRKLRSHVLLHDLSNLGYGPRRFAYKDLKKATKGFSKECKLGQGGFGAVYRGKLVLDHNNNKKKKKEKEKSSNNCEGSVEVAVKVLEKNSKQGEKEFKAEIVSIGRMRHKNLVQLLGWSYDHWKGQPVLVYEYMPNQSLDRWLNVIGRGGRPQQPTESLMESSTESSGRNILGWAERYHVLKGVASGIVYLHEEWEMVVVHRDLKPGNIMLDAEFNAKLGDFGLARLIKNRDRIFHHPGGNGISGGDGILGNGILGESTQTFTIAGTPGYMAPECLESGSITKESDVYSFGAVAMEVATGRKLSSENLNWLWNLYQENRLIEAAGVDLMGTEGFDEKQLELVLKLSLACCQTQPSSRPSMRQILHALSSSSSSPSSSSDPRNSVSFIDSNFPISRPYSSLSVSPLSLSSLSITLPSTSNPSIS